MGFRLVGGTSCECSIPFHDFRPSLSRMEYQKEVAPDPVPGARSLLSYVFVNRLAYRSGVTSAITPPASAGVFGGISTAFFTGAAHKLQDHAVIKKVAALHVSVGAFGKQPSVSSQIAALRKALLGGFSGPRGEYFKQAAEVSFSFTALLHQDCWSGFP